jgi:hypothetical protein
MVGIVDMRIYDGYNTFIFEEFDPVAHDRFRRRRKT